ncbi:hypothetical protein AVKW3434_21195 [Acidovorax sp. SUPP3434]|uniref:hypothetical protein n=1 Tax=Acidovorax sp. SUPP3434 TaxID=2920880 RepID=UPI0023DE4393|nr:hypothetical protein [Acidovorax sp. SUPP3434]GKT01950.1 hypothetical protein AVKW3434_21195 [Acidovorax sp. SUPP3434]
MLLEKQSRVVAEQVTLPQRRESSGRFFEDGRQIVFGRALRALPGCFAHADPSRSVGQEDARPIVFTYCIMDFFHDLAAYNALRRQTVDRDNAHSPESPPASPRGSSSFSTHSLREALPSLPRRAASPEPDRSSSWQREAFSGYESHGGWQEHHGGWHGSSADWHGAPGGEYPAAPVDAWSSPAWGAHAGSDVGRASGHFPTPSAAPALEARAREWVELCSTTLRHDGADERLAQAVQNLFMVFVDSPTFRQTMATIEAEGPVRMRVDPEEATAHFDGQRRQVVLGEIMARDPSMAMGVLAFELSNASLSSAFLQCDRKAVETRMSPREYAEAVERIEYNSSRNVQAYFMEALQTLRRAGLANQPNAWHCRVTDQGHIEPGNQSEQENLAQTQASGHFGRYEQSYAAAMRPTK